MIISASRRTDIPAFYGDWFMNRVREGFFYRVNPFNSRQVKSISLKPEDVDAICFWSKNPAPLLQHLNELERYRLNYYFQFTLNPYGTSFEPLLPPLRERIATFRKLADRIGPKRVIWRYDPVILSSETEVEWHLEQAERIAAELKGFTCRLMFSFCDFYGKGEGRLSRALNGSGIMLQELSAPKQHVALQKVAEGFKAIADGYGLQIFSCGEELDLAGSGISHGACIDAELIQELFKVKAATGKDRNQRKACRCAASADMGSYNTCYFRCAYCYANFNERMIDTNSRKHFSDSRSLLGRCA